MASNLGPMSGHADEGRILQRAEFEALIAPRLEQLRAWVRRRAGPALRAREPVSDLLQSALGEMLEDAGQVHFTDEAAFRRWVHQVALHKVISKGRFHSARKRESGRVTHLASGVFDLPDRHGSAVAASPSEHAVHAEDLARLADALDELDERDREIVCLRRFYDVPTPEIATLLGMPESTVRWRLAQATTQLATRLR